MLPEFYPDYNCSCYDCLHRRRHACNDYPFSHHHDDHHACESSSGSHSCSHRRSFDYKTRDVTIRGKAFAVRASYLLEQGKFEKELVSFMDKKTEEEVPDRVVDMLISFINCEAYENKDPLDEVTLNVLASNVGAKSVVEFSQGRMKDLERRVNEDNLVDIVCTIMRSSNVNDSMKKWLEKYLRKGDGWMFLNDLKDFNRVIRDHPEVMVELEVMLGLRGKPQDDGQRVL